VRKIARVEAENNLDRTMLMGIQRAKRSAGSNRLIHQLQNNPSGFKMGLESQGKGKSTGVFGAHDLDGDPWEFKANHAVTQIQERKYNAFFHTIKQHP
jgi:hypothetical protein